MMTYKNGFELGIETARDMEREEVMDLIKSIDEETTELNGNSDYNTGFIEGLLETLR